MILKGKKGLIMGVANDKSLAWGIAKACHEHGAELAFSYQSDLLLKRVKPLAESIDSNFLIECDVSNDQSLDNAFKNIQEKWGELDFIVHAIAYADRSSLKGKYVDTPRDHFHTALDVSCYSFVACAQRAAKLMKNGGNMVTLSYYGAEKVIPNYNVMGVAKAALETSVQYMAADLGPDNIRVNAISAGPVKTLAASAIGDFKAFLKYSADNTPLRRNTTQEDLGNNALYLLSDLSSGVTGEVVHVDSGYHTMGMKLPDQSE